MERLPQDRSWPLVARVVAFLPLVFVIHVAAIGVAAAAGPFAGFSGSWAGSGSVTFKNGAGERIRCQSQNTTSNGDNMLQQTLQCASASYQFKLNTEISHSNGKISGVWSESTQDVSGNVTGQASDGRIQAYVSGAGFSASVAVTLSGNGQAVRMRPQEDKRVREVSIEMRRN